MLVSTCGPGKDSNLPSSPDLGRPQAPTSEAGACVSWGILSLSAFLAPEYLTVSRSAFSSNRFTCGGYSVINVLGNTLAFRF